MTMFITLDKASITFH